jgi:hypothetical protein
LTWGEEEENELRGEEDIVRLMAFLIFHMAADTGIVEILLFRLN